MQRRTFLRTITAAVSTWMFGPRLQPETVTAVTPTLMRNRADIGKTALEEWLKVGVGFDPSPGNTVFIRAVNGRGEATPWHCVAGEKGIAELLVPSRMIEGESGEIRIDTVSHRRPLVNIVEDHKRHLDEHISLLQTINQKT